MHSREVVQEVTGNSEQYQWICGIIKYQVRYNWIKINEGTSIFLIP